MKYSGFIYGYTKISTIIIECKHLSHQLLSIFKIAHKLSSSMICDALCSQKNIAVVAESLILERY